MSSHECKHCSANHLEEVFELQAQLKECEEQCGQLQAGIHGYIADIHGRDEVNHDLLQELESVQESKRQLREALEFYKTRSNWTSDRHGLWTHYYIDDGLENHYKLPNEPWKKAEEALNADTMGEKE